MKKKWWILALVVLTVAIFVRIHSVNVQRKQRLLNEVTESAIERHGYTHENYLFELEDTDAAGKPASLIKITSKINNKSWEFPYGRLGSKIVILSDFVADNDKMQSDTRVFLDSLRTYGFFPETEKVKFKEIANDYNIKYPKQKIEIKLLGIH